MKKTSLQMALDKVFEGHKNRVIDLVYLSYFEKEYLKRVSEEIHNDRKKDIFYKKNLGENGGNNSEDKITKAHHAYTLEEYLKTYDPERMYEVGERMKLRGIEIQAYGTNLNKYVGDIVKVSTTFHILEGRIGKIINTRNSLFLVQVNYRDHLIQCLFNKKELTHYVQA